MSADLDAMSIAELCLHGPNIAVQIGQTEHRIDIVRRFRMQPGEKVLELGCGQGDTTAVLATLAGDEGHVTAIDPGPLDYGSPYTLSQAQSHLSASPVGHRITFIQADPVMYLSEHPEQRYDTAVLAHCIWYFSSPSVLSSILALLSTCCKRICIAEYALTASSLAAVPSVLAALTLASLECRKPSSESNIRTVLSPAAITAICLSDAALKLTYESTKTPPATMHDGRWEVAHVLNEAFIDEVNECVKDVRERSVVFALRDAVKNNKEALGEVKVATMDVWAAVFVPM